MINVLRTAAGVLVNPIHTFAAIRDNDHLHFPRALAITAVVYGLSALSALPFLVNVRDPATGVIGFGEATGTILILVWAMGTLAQVVFMVAVYYIGKAWGGSRHWRKVFSVILYTNVAAVVPSIAGVVEAYAGYDPVVSAVSQTLDTVFVIWLIVVTIIAIKIVNGFGIGRAIATGLVAVVAAAAAVVPLMLITLLPLILNAIMLEDVAGAMFGMR